ncbi:PREDICTED: 39S ribosomal protein L22, mitochondrial-like [Amphimedon queenslandica]|uniref:Large ribosomal subunit protein uL22m n=1 Tax=Amphimedon queenslandica TaxID=400682 RepID=A0AAN0K2P1_AMPQE|nr:PREDICTED: 39S ribosomal protein L22, mitochondrial-like [Amphimedon queenslandica]|eukprot:XP_019863821.1 PREDICTED: 39S ribosomal protein L22, mitochondrial-like [Amphimedon queenslandica]
MQTIKETQRNAIQIHKANPDNLYVSASYVGKGTYLKRIRYHGKGQSGKMYKYYSHYFLKLREGPPPVKKKKSKEAQGCYATRRLIQRGPITIPNCL